MDGTEMSKALLAEADRMVNEAQHRANILRQSAAMLTGVPLAAPAVRVGPRAGKGEVVDQTDRAGRKLANGNEAPIDYPDLKAALRAGVPENPNIANQVYAAMPKLIKMGRWKRVPGGFRPVIAAAPVATDAPK